MQIVKLRSIACRNLKYVKKHFPELKSYKPKQGTDSRYHFVYLILNLVDSKFYIGKHTCKRQPSSVSTYFGSGQYLKNAIQAHGISNFRMSILRYFKTAKNAFKYERDSITLKMVKSKFCYNLQEGGSGFSSFKAKQVALNRVQKGTHPLLKREDGSSVGKDRHEKCILLGTHNWQKREDGSSQTADRVLKGIHPFQTRLDGSNFNRDRVIAGTHPLQRRSDGTSVTSDRVLKGTHPFQGIKPWEHHKATNETKLTWKLANKLYKIHLKNPKLGYYALTTLGSKVLETFDCYGFLLNVEVIKGMIKKFKNNWIPINDSEWKNFHRNYRCEVIK